MDELSDKLVLRIFSHVKDGTTLLQVLPLVCRRWRELSRDPGAWAAVELVWPNTEFRLAEQPPHARLLRRAPALRRLHLQVGYGMEAFTLTS